MKALTKKQLEIVDFIQEFTTNHRYSPSYREIAEKFEFSSLGSVYKHIHALKKKGVLLFDSKASRSIVLSSPAEKSEAPNEIEIPFIGHISAGNPIETFPDRQQIAIARSLVHAPDKCYALRAQGDSLTEELIADGDLLIVEARQEANPGETIIALINNHDTIIKRYYPEGTFIHLIGTFAHHHPIILREEDVLIQGVLVALLRTLG